MMLSIFFLLITLASGIPLKHEDVDGPKGKHFTRTSRYARLTSRTDLGHVRRGSSLSSSTLIRPTQSEIQPAIEVMFNGVPRYLLMDTGSADTWMISHDIQCLDPLLAPAPRSACNLGDPYTGPEIPRIGNETYYNSYGSTEVVTGPVGYADVTVAGFTVQKQKVALINRGFIIGDNVRSGVFGLAPGAITSLFESTNATNSAPNGTSTTYSTFFEGLVKSHEDELAPLFSFAFQRGEEGGYIAFGGLPPITFSEDFAFTPFVGLNFSGKVNPQAYYPIETQGFELNGANESTTFKAVVDSGTYVNRLPADIADRVNAAFNPPAVFNSSLSSYVTSCHATVPTFALKIGGKTFTMPREDMFLPVNASGICTTTITRGFKEPQPGLPDGFYAIGAAFLHSVVAVFDVGGGGMHFAKHNY